MSDTWEFVLWNKEHLFCWHDDLVHFVVNIPLHQGGKFVHNRESKFISSYWNHALMLFSNAFHTFKHHISLTENLLFILDYIELSFFLLKNKHLNNLSYLAIHFLLYSSYKVYTVIVVSCGYFSLVLILCWN